MEKQTKRNFLPCKMAEKKRKVLKKERKLQGTTSFCTMEQYMSVRKIILLNSIFGTVPVLKDIECFFAYLNNFYVKWMRSGKFFVMICFSKFFIITRINLVVKKKDHRVWKLFTYALCVHCFLNYSRFTHF